jgi:hypothetical protein
MFSSPNLHFENSFHPAVYLVSAQQMQVILCVKYSLFCKILTDTKFEYF